VVGVGLDAEVVEATTLGFLGVAGTVVEEIGCGFAAGGNSGVRFEIDVGCIDGVGKCER
jgi:RNase P/RNase MRP subunit p29